MHSCNMVWQRCLILELLLVGSLTMATMIVAVVSRPFSFYIDTWFPFLVLKSKAFCLCACERVCVGFNTIASNWKNRLFITFSIDMLQCALMHDRYRLFLFFRSVMYVLYPTKCAWINDRKRQSDNNVGKQTTNEKNNNFECRIP